MKFKDDKVIFQLAVGKFLFKLRFCGFYKTKQFAVFRNFRGVCLNVAGRDSRVEVAGAGAGAGKGRGCGKCRG